ncbi:MAG TPA: hypothetical protein VFK73_10285 [Paludibacter sp.]|nr:hypothetical protein [Paludibacter sp.]
MTSKQSSIYSMLRRVLLFLKKSSDLFTALPVMADLTTEIETNLNEIDSYKEQQATDITGLRKQKDNFRKTALQKAVEISHAIQVYAQMTGNEVLANEIYYTESGLNKMSDNELDTTLGVIYKSADANKDKLTAYGVTPAKVTDYKAAADAFKAAIGTPKGGTIGRKQSTDQLSVLFEAEMATIDKVDLMMDTFKFSNPPLYNEYQNNRKINFISGSLMVNASITDAETGTGLPGVKMEFMLDQTLVLEKTTGVAGGMNVKSLDPGIYIVKLSKIGYATQQVQLNVPGDNLVTLNVSMAKELLVIPVAQ